MLSISRNRLKTILKSFLFFIPLIVSIIDNISLHWKIIICISAFVVYLITELLDTKYSTEDSIIQSLNQVKSSLIENINERLPRVIPDSGLPSIKIIDEAINSIKSNGYIDFFVEGNYSTGKKSHDLFLYESFEGMHQVFLIFVNSSTYLQVIKPIDYPLTAGMTDSRDYVMTWFRYIFPVLGNTSKNISEKYIHPITNNPNLSECHIISKYKIFHVYTRKKKYRLRIFI